MMMDVNQTYCDDHSATHKDNQLLCCTSETTICQLYLNFKNHYVQKIKKKFSHNSERRSCLMERIFFMIASILLVQGKTNQGYSLGSAKY